MAPLTPIRRNTASQQPNQKTKRMREKKPPHFRAEAAVLRAPGPSPAPSLWLMRMVAPAVSEFIIAMVVHRGKTTLLMTERFATSRWPRKALFTRVWT